MLRRLKRALPFALFRKDLFPIGADLRVDIPRLLGGQQPAVILDIGANTGQTFRRFRSYFPNSFIYSFEPVNSTYQQLHSTFGNDRRGVFVNKAVGAQCGKTKINVSSGSECSSIVFATDKIAEEIVEQTTIDQVLEENGIGTIDLLKSDTEGWDLEVMRGASDALTAGLIKLILVETTPTPECVKCTALSEMAGFLFKHGYRPYAFYDFGRYRGSLIEPIDFMNTLFIRRSEVL